MTGEEKAYLSCSRGRRGVSQLEPQTQSFQLWKRLDLFQVGQYPRIDVTHGTGSRGFPAWILVPGHKIRTVSLLANILSVLLTILFVCLFVLLLARLPYYFVHFHLSCLQPVSFCNGQLCGFDIIFLCWSRSYFLL